MNGFRLLVADLTGRILADCRHDGETVKWSGHDVAFGRSALEMARLVDIGNAESGKLKAEMEEVEIKFADKTVGDPSGEEAL